MSERDFWLAIRRSLLGIVATIEKRWDIVPRDMNGASAHAPAPAAREGITSR